MLSANRIFKINLADSIMSHFKLNPSFKTNLQRCLDDWSQQIFTHTDRVISEPRYWDGWETSDPFRDIVDTEDLRNSGELTFVSPWKRRMTWATPYVGYVYYGYSLPDGRRIPDRRWVHIAFEENDYKALLVRIIRSRMKR